MQLDKFDRAILTCVQDNNLLTHTEIAAKVHLSPSSVRRRLARLRDEGFIVADVSIVDRSKAGSAITIIINVSFEHETPDAYDAFRRKISKAAEVSQCYSVAGQVDFVLICHARDLAEHEKWAERVLMSDPNIKRCSSHVAWSCTKFSTKVMV